MKKFIFAILSVTMLVAFSVSVSFGTHEIPKPGLVKFEKCFTSVDANIATLELSEVNFSPGTAGIIFIGYSELTASTRMIHPFIKRSDQFIRYKEYLHLNNKSLQTVSYNICPRHAC